MANTIKKLSLEQQKIGKILECVEDMYELIILLSENASTLHQIPQLDIRQMAQQRLRDCGSLLLKVSQQI